MLAASSSCSPGPVNLPLPPKTTTQIQTSNSSLTRTFSSQRLKDKEKAHTAGATGEEGGGGGSGLDGSLHEKSEKSSYWSHRSHKEDRAHSTHNSKGIPEFGLIGEEVYARKDIEAFLMVVRGYQPDEGAWRD